MNYKKKFGGLVYTQVAHRPTKREAQKVAQEYRDDYYNLARVVYGGKGTNEWLIYAHPLKKTGRKK